MCVRVCVRACVFVCARSTMIDRLVSGLDSIKGKGWPTPGAVTRLSESKKVAMASGSSGGRLRSLRVELDIHSRVPCIPARFGFFLGGSVQEVQRIGSCGGGPSMHSKKLEILPAFAFFLKTLTHSCCWARFLIVRHTE